MIWIRGNGSIVQACRKEGEIHLKEEKTTTKGERKRRGEKGGELRGAGGCTVCPVTTTKGERKGRRG